MTISTIVRRTHMFLALFFFPWILMYALSTLVMNHRSFFVTRYGEGPVPFVTERRLVYDGVFSENAELRTISSRSWRRSDSMVRTPFRDGKTDRSRSTGTT